MISFVEHEIKRDNNSISKVTYFCDNQSFRYGVELNNGFTDDYHQVEINLNSLDRKEIRPLLDKFESMCVAENAEPREKSNDFDFCHTSIVDDKSRKLVVNNKKVYKYHVYDSKKCNELFKEIVRFLKTTHKEEFYDYNIKLKKALQDPDSRFDLYYVGDGFSIKIEYDSFHDDYMFITFMSTHAHISGGSQFRVNKKDVPTIYEDCKKIAEIIRNCPSKEKFNEYQRIPRLFGNICGIQEKETNGSIIYVKGNENIEPIMENIMLNISKINIFVREKLDKIRSFDFESTVAPEEKLREKYPFFFDESSLNETGYKVICNLIDQYFPELNDEDKDEANEMAQSLAKTFKPRKNNNE